MKYRIYRPNLSSFIVVEAQYMQHTNEGTLLFNDKGDLIATIPPTVSVVQDTSATP